MKRLIITLLLAAFALYPQPLEAEDDVLRARGVASAPVDMSYLDGADFSLFLGKTERKAASYAAPASNAAEEISTLPVCLLRHSRKRLESSGARSGRHRALLGLRLGRVD